MIRAGSSPSECTPRVSAILQEAKPKAGSFSGEKKKPGKRTADGSEAQKPAIQIVPDLPLDCLLSFS